jgi:Class II flagellar assembly regulator
MKVQSPTSTRSVSTARKAADRGGVKTDEFARALEGDPEVDSASAVTGSTSVGAIDSLLSVQEMSGEEESRKQAKARGEELLQKLDGLRHALLAGDLSVDQLDGLVALVNTERSYVNDPGLSETLDEIELRARVELAKLNREV